MKLRGERWGGAAWRLVKRGVDRERGMMGRGKVGPEEITSRGNIGRQILNSDSPYSITYICKFSEYYT
jgi:hypothetical protein